MLARARRPRPALPTLHPLFERFAIALANHNDAIAERAVTLGGVAHGTARHVAKHSRLAEYPHSVDNGLGHVAALADRIETYLVGVRESRAAIESLHDTDTVDLLTGVISDLEKNAWFLRATLA